MNKLLLAVELIALALIGVQLTVSTVKAFKARRKKTSISLKIGGTTLAVNEYVTSEELAASIVQALKESKGAKLDASVR